MHHWMDPQTRGVYTHPAAQPPRPQSHASNDLGTRLARVEEHLSFGAWNRDRIEREAQQRDRDLGAGITGLETVQEDHEKRLQTLEQDRHTRSTILSLLDTARGSVGVLVQFVVAVLATALLLTGNANVVKIKELLSIWGAGSPGH